MEKTMIVQLSIKKENLQKFKMLAENMISESLNEIGCKKYRLLSDTKNSNDFIIYEKYSDLDALEKHKSSKHLREFTNSVTPFLSKEPMIETF